MNRPLVLGLALSTRSWRGALQRHCRDHVADVSVTLVRDSRDAIESAVDVVMLDDDTSWLSGPSLTALREAGIAVIGLFDPLEADGHGHRHLQRLGVDAVLTSSCTNEQLVEAARASQPDRETQERFAELSVIEGDRRPADARQVLAVGGPAGAGATEVAVALAQLWGGIRPVLIDVDETHPSISRRLGLSVHPHIVTAVESLRGERVHADGTPGERLEDCLANRAIGDAKLPFDVIAGLASRDDWSLVRADDVSSLIDELAARWPLVVAKLGPQLEDLSRYVDRHAVSRTVAARATRIIGVCHASPVGVLRFVDWLVDVVALGTDTPIDVVLNQAPSASSSRSQLEHQLREIAGDRIGSIVVAPRDKKVERAAWDAALTRRGAFLKAIARLPLEETVVLAERSAPPETDLEAGSAESTEDAEVAA